MKKKLSIIIVIAFSLILSACSSEKTGEVKVTKENKSYLEKYDDSLQGFIEEMTDILQEFNNSLDKVYTQDYSKDQFAANLKDSIKESNKLVTKVESIDVDPQLFEAHQNMIVLINRSHQLLLNSIAMANEEEQIDKDSLRTEYIGIKTEQANIANQWKILRLELQKEKQ